MEQHIIVGLAGGRLQVEPKKILNFIAQLSLKRFPCSSQYKPQCKQSDCNFIKAKTKNQVASTR
jgi:hypothetical protein